MKVYCLKEDALLFYKSNCQNQLDYYQLNDNELLIKSYEGDPFIETRYEVEDFELDMSTDKPALTDLENVKRIYNTFSFLTESQASDERLWSALAIQYFWKYVQYRWNIKENNTKNNIESHYYFKYHSRRSYTRNAISRLWWIGRLTFDEDSTDPYMLTEYLCRHSDFIMHLLERNQSNNKKIIKEFLYALIDLEKSGIIINTDDFGALTKYLNILGGTYILDCLPSQYIFKKIQEKVKSMKENVDR